MASLDYMNADAVIACAALVGRSGATDFEIGYLHDDVPIEHAAWYATAFYRGARLTADDHKSPTLAATALAERILRGATCRCGENVVLVDGAEGCRWQLVGKNWKPGCDVPPLTIREGVRGDVAAMERALKARKAGAQ